ncbi:hypothetical protein OAF54_02125 [bacterium]|nr:hypothetical protein [bacterium]
MGQGFSKFFTLTSGGAAYNLICGFAPDEVKVLNVTKFATDNTNCEFQWDALMADGYAYARKTGDGEVNSEIITSNGFSKYAATSFTDISQVISGATAAATCVITVASSAGYAAGDGVRIKDVVGMTELNGNLYKVLSVPSSTTVELDVNSSSFTAYSSGGNAYNQSQKMVDSGGEGITLGTSVVGADSDVLHVYVKQNSQGGDAKGDIG